MTTSRQNSVVVRIEALVLEGFSEADRFRIADAAERELSRLLSERGLPFTPSEGIHMPRLMAEPIEIAPGLNPEVTGSRIARALYGGMRR